MQNRNASSRVLNHIVERWSPRAFDAMPMPAADLEVILEAAGLAPSAFNAQPWRFLYSHRGDANWELFLSLLMPMNAAWVKNASVLLFILSDTQMIRDGKASPLRSHSFDAGAAWAMMALQALEMGYHTHAMAGVDFDRAQAELQVPDRFRIEAAVAIGRQASPEILPEALREREMPSGRRPVSELSAAGLFTALPG